MKICRPVFSMPTKILALWAKRLVELATKLEQISEILPHHSRFLAEYKNLMLLREYRWIESRKRLAKRSPKCMMTMGQSIFCQAMEVIIPRQKVCGSKRRKPR